MTTWRKPSPATPQCSPTKKKAYRAAKRHATARGTHTASCPQYTGIVQALPHCPDWCVSSQIRGARGVLHAYALRQHVSLLLDRLRVFHEPPGNVKYPYHYQLGNGQCILPDGVSRKPCASNVRRLKRASEMPEFVLLVIVSAAWWSTREVHSYAIQEK